MVPGRGLQRERYAFAVSLEGQVWNIRLIPSDPERRPITYLEIGCDGETLFVFARQNENLASRTPPSAKMEKALNEGFAQIIPDTVPGPRLCRCEALWLAYCSGECFRTNTTGKARQIWLSGALPLDGRLTNIQVQASWDWLPEGRRFLSHVEYFPTPLTVPRENERRGDHNSESPLVVLNVVQSKPLADFSVPTQFEFIRYREEDPRAKSPLVTITGAATNIYLGAPLADPRPRITVPVVMMDYRFQKASPPMVLFQHLVTNGIWESMASVSSTKQFAMAKRTAPRERPPKVGWSVAFIAFALASAAAFWLWSRRAKESASPT